MLTARGDEQQAQLGTVTPHGAPACMLSFSRCSYRARCSRTIQPAENLVSTAPMRGAAGAVVGAIAVVQDIEERKKAEETQRLLVAELNHRVKNTLASVQAIAHQMLRRTKNDPAEFVTSFSGRIQSLSSNRLLT